MGILRLSSKIPFFLIKAIEIQKFVFTRNDLIMQLWYRNFLKKIYIKSYIQKIKICYFRSFYIKLRENSDHGKI